MTKKKVEFAPGCFDEMGDLTQEEMDDLVAQIEEMFEDDAVFDEMVQLEELDPEEQEEILKMIDRNNNTRH